MCTLYHMKGSWKKRDGHFIAVEAYTIRKDAHPLGQQLEGILSPSLAHKAQQH